MRDETDVLVASAKRRKNVEDVSVSASRSWVEKKLTEWGMPPDKPNIDRFMMYLAGQAYLAAFGSGLTKDDVFLKALPTRQSASPTISWGAAKTQVAEEGDAHEADSIDFCVES